MDPQILTMIMSQLQGGGGQQPMNFGPLPRPGTMQPQEIGMQMPHIPVSTGQNDDLKSVVYNFNPNVGNTPTTPASSKGASPTLMPMQPGMELSPAPDPSMQPGMQQPDEGILSGMFKDPETMYMIGQVLGLFPQSGMVGRAGTALAGMGQNAMHQQQLQKLLGGQSSFKQGIPGGDGIGAGMLTPEMQNSVLSVAMEHEMQPFNKALMMSQMARNLRKPGQTAAGMKVEVLNVDKQGNPTPARQKHKWLINEQTGEKIEWLGAFTTPDARAGGGAGAPTRISDASKFLVEEFYGEAIESAAKKVGGDLARARQLITFLKGPNAGTLNPAKVKHFLSAKSKRGWSKGMREYLGSTPSKAGEIYYRRTTGDVEALAEILQPKTSAEARAIPPGKPYKLPKSGRVVVNVKDGDPILYKAKEK